jgi:hypothetical protein
MITKKEVLSVVVVLALATAPSFATDIKIQFDFSDKAPGPYTGTNSPGHIQGRFGGGDTNWNTIAAATSDIMTGPFLFADGTAATGVEAQLGVGWNYTDNDTGWTWGMYASETDSGVSGFYDTPMARDIMHNENGMGFRVRGLPAGNYRAYVVAVSPIPEMIVRTYLASIGLNLTNDFGAAAQTIGRGEIDSWAAASAPVDGKSNYAFIDLTVGGPTDWISFILNKKNADNGAINAVQIHGVLPAPKGTLVMMR